MLLIKYTILCGFIFLLTANLVFSVYYIFDFCKQKKCKIRHFVNEWRKNYANDSVLSLLRYLEVPWPVILCLKFREICKLLLQHPTVVVLYCLLIFVYPIARTLQRIFVLCCGLSQIRSRRYKFDGICYVPTAQIRDSTSSWVPFLYDVLINDLITRYTLILLAPQPISLKTLQIISAEISFRLLFGLPRNVLTFLWMFDMRFKNVGQDKKRSRKNLSVRCRQYIRAIKYTIQDTYQSCFALQFYNFINKNRILKFGKYYRVIITTDRSHVNMSDISKQLVDLFEEFVCRPLRKSNFQIENAFKPSLLKSSTITNINAVEIYFDQFNSQNLDERGEFCVIYQSESHSLVFKCAFKQLVVALYFMKRINEFIENGDIQSIELRICDKQNVPICNFSLSCDFGTTAQPSLQQLVAAIQKIQAIDAVFVECGIAFSPTTDAYTNVHSLLFYIVESGYVDNHHFDIVYENIYKSKQ